MYDPSSESEYLEMRVCVILMGWGGGIGVCLMYM